MLILEDILLQGRVYGLRTDRFDVFVTFSFLWHLIQHMLVSLIFLRGRAEGPFFHNQQGYDYGMGVT